MTDSKETKESQETVKPQESTDKDLTTVGRSSMRGEVKGPSDNPQDTPKDANSKGDQPPEEPKGEEIGGDKPPGDPQDSPVERPTIRPRKSPEHLREPEKGTITIEVHEGSKITTPEGFRPGGLERGG
jgi:hypothetical protein